jgi:hypothetical protein
LICYICFLFCFVLVLDSEPSFVSQH